MPKNPVSTSSFFLPATVATLAGSAIAVVVVTNALSTVLESTPRWLPLAVAMLVSITAYQVSLRQDAKTIESTPRTARYALVLLNGFLIYASAFGVQGTALSQAAEDVSSNAETGKASGTLTVWRPLVTLDDRTVKVVDPNHQIQRH